jgi:hypothetical protein
MAQATPLEKGAGSRTQAAGQTEERCQHDMPAVGGKGGGCRTTWQEGFAVRARAITARRWMDPGVLGRRADERKSDGDARVRRRSSTAPASPPGRHPLVSLRMHAMRRGMGSCHHGFMGHAAGTGRDPAARARAIGSIIG